MAEQTISTTIADAPMAIPTEVANAQSATLANGVAVIAPVVACAYSWALLMFNGSSANSGAKITINYESVSITVTLDNAGRGIVSLVPFIRESVLAHGALDNPLYCPDGEGQISNPYREVIRITMAEGDDAPTSMDISYIFGNYTPTNDIKRDIYRDYDPDGDTWCSIDAASNYLASGAPENFYLNWCNVNEILTAEPTNDFKIEVDCAWFKGLDDTLFDTFTFHFRYDCRRDNIVKLRWLDNNGNINTRKFVTAGRNYGASTSATWQRPQPLKLIMDDYNRGRDQWAAMTATETLTAGDDNIPMTHYDWVKTVASAPAVEAYLHGAWTRVNVGEVSLECDPRKSVFAITLTLSLPTDEVQQF